MQLRTPAQRLHARRGAGRAHGHTPLRKPKKCGAHPVPTGRTPRDDGTCSTHGPWRALRKRAETLTINHTGTAGKGISCDGAMRLLGGTQHIVTNGDSSTYTNASNAADTYASTGLKCDGD